MFQQATLENYGQAEMPEWDAPPPLTSL